MSFLKKLFFSAFAFTPFIAHSAIQDHFKKAENKSDIHSMPGIDFIYMINLDQRPEKFESAALPFHSYGIFPYRFSAFNGWEMSFEDIQDVGVRLEPHHTHKGMGTCYVLQNGHITVEHELILEDGKTYFSHCLARGPMGCIISHLSVLQDAYDSGYNTIWVMEDDAEIIQDPWLVPELVEKLDKLAPDWDVLYTDPDTKNSKGEYIRCTGVSFRPNFEYQTVKAYQKQRYKVGKDFFRVGMRYGTYSMLVRRSGMKKILDFFKTYHIFLPYDFEIWAVPGIKIYSTARDYISTFPVALSDNGAPRYLDK